MSDKTNIAWTDYTWSPWLGCRKVSPGCENCYITSTPVFKFRKIKHGEQRVRTSESYWKQPLRWNNYFTCDCGAVKVHVKHPCPPACPKCKSAYRSARVFPSLCDPFDQETPDEWREQFWNLVDATPNLTWLILTKRIENVSTSDCPDNVWLGVSCEDQKRADERIPILLTIPARVRFLSVEPMLERIDLTKVECWRTAETGMLPDGAKAELAIDWVIFGGESGKNARPCNIEWIRDGVRQCKEARVQCFVKQLGSRPAAYESCEDCDPCVAGHPEQCAVGRSGIWYPVKHPKGGEPAEWPEDLRVREFPKACIELSTPPPRVC